MLDANGLDVRAPGLPTCANDRLLCRDLSAVARLEPEYAAISRSEDAIDVTFSASERPRTLVVSEMFRRAWVAAAPDGSLSTFPFLDSLLAVRVPAGATAV